MNRKELEQYIQETYAARIDYPYGSVPDDTIKMLLDMSYQATKNKRK